MNKINNIKLMELLPESIRNDSDIIAAANALDLGFLSIVEDVDKIIIIPNVEKLEEELLDHLAFYLHVDFYDLTFDVETKRELVKESVYLHQIKGTPTSVERAIYTVFGKAKLREWFDYGGDPYYFSVDIYATKKGVSQENLIKLERLIETYKNKRSWLETINIFLTSKGKFYISSALIGGEEITVYPYSPTSIESKGKVYIATGNDTTVENMAVYPRKEKEVI